MRKCFGARLIKRPSRATGMRACKLEAQDMCFSVVLRRKQSRRRRRRRGEKMQSCQERPREAKINDCFCTFPPVRGKVCFFCFFLCCVLPLHALAWMQRTKACKSMHKAIVHALSSTRHAGTDPPPTVA